MARPTGELDDGRVVFGTNAAAAETKARDPVCGMLVNLSAASSALHDGHTYFFCSPECKAKFEVDPAQYLRRV
jgi:YHS domain-containing protein